MLWLMEERRKEAAAALYVGELSRGSASWRDCQRSQSDDCGQNALIQSGRSKQNSQASSSCYDTTTGNAVGSVGWRLVIS